MDKQLLARLALAREIAGIPFVITSAIRCDQHNYDVGGARHSTHKTGHAIDVLCTSDADRWTIIRALINAGINRIGDAKTFVHFDNAPYARKNRFWRYMDK